MWGRGVCFVCVGAFEPGILCLGIFGVFVLERGTSIVVLRVC